MLDAKFSGTLASSSGQEMDLVMCTDTGRAPRQIKTRLSLTGCLHPRPPYISIRKEPAASRSAQFPPPVMKYQNHSEGGGAHTHVEMI